MGISILFYFLIINFEETTFASGVVKVFSSIIFIGLIYYFVKGIGLKWNLPKLTTSHQLLILIVIVLFVFNNLSQKYYYKVDFGNDGLKSHLLFFAISSSWEEIIYRGFLQNYIDDKLAFANRISKGIIVSSFVFVLMHLHFFTFMPVVSAIFSFCLVAFFSIVMGILIRETKSLLLVCFLHILVNFIHLFIQM